MSPRKAKVKRPRQCEDCRQRVVFVRMPSGKFMPVDPYPVPGIAPNVAIRNRAHQWIGYVVSRDHPLAPGWHLTTNHPASCRARERREPKPEPEKPATLF